MIRWSPLYGVRDRLPEGCGFVEGVAVDRLRELVWAARDPASSAPVLKSQLERRQCITLASRQTSEVVGDPTPGMPDSNLPLLPVGGNSSKTPDF